MNTTPTRTESFSEKTTLDNGIRVLTGAMTHTHSVSICVYVGVGSRYETAETAGISHVVEHLVFKGTKRRPSPSDISGTIEGVGGVMNAGTEHELTVYWCKVARPYMEESLDLLIDMLRDSLYDPEEIERERMVVMEELGMVNDHPGYKVDTLIDEMLWPDHPLGRDVSGSRESVSGITREMIVHHVDQFYTPSNMVVSVAGNINHQQVVRQVDSLTVGWPSQSPPPWTPFDRDQAASQHRLEYRKTQQAHLSIGVPGVSISHPGRYALDLLSVVLGEGMSSRLFLELREKHALAYDVQSGVTHFLDTGAFVINAGVDPKRVYTAVEMILAELGKLREGVPQEELDKAKRLSTGRLMLRMEDTRAVAAWMGTQEILLGRILDVDDIVQRVNAVTPQEVDRIARELLLTDKLNLALVGPCRGERRLQRALRL